ncbi:ATP-binding protein [Chitinophaga nivalis]|uniref:histidine kinase n=1 Tax=Chitinophaga nivalis TaxID=2991709 RepID=A0ABT3IIC2_9BACT|nr:ATP-binding protein [Chitinophaga nivalis]MCW3466759.1 response regulator [Chitinophaga nivalis]MCW3483550.1 response regulator [Chitinophaga nivalis]
MKYLNHVIGRQRSYIPGFIQRLINTGTAAVTDPAKKRSILLINSLALLTGTMVFAIGLYFYYLIHSRMLLTGVIIEGSCFYGILYLNKKQQHTLANTAMLLVHAFSAIYFGSLFGIVLPLELVSVFLIVCLGFGSCLLYKDIRIRAIGFSAAFILLAVIEANNYFKVIIPLPLSDSNRFIFRWFCQGGVILLITYVITALIRENDHLFNSLRMANLYKRIFLQEVSHEIRTPLNAVFGNAQLLERKTEKYFTPELLEERPELQELQELVDCIISSSNHSRRVLNNILELSAIDQGKLDEVKKGPFHLTIWLRDILKIHEHACQERSILTELKMDRLNIPSMIISDKMKCTQILHNLLSNAIKFAPSHSRVTVAVFRIQDDLYLQVTNAGKPISKEMQEEIFQPFVTGKDGFTEGTGLGLYITRKLVEQLNGIISIQSMEEENTTFTVRFSELLKERYTQDKPILPPSAREIKNKRILIIDDEITCRDVVRKYLDGNYFIQAENGVEGLRMAKTEKPDIIILDTHMPEMGGIETLHLIREDAEIANIPVVFTSGDGFSESRELYMAAGANDFVIKPIDFNELNSVLTRHLDR